MQQTLQVVFAGLEAGAIYGLIAMSYNIIFGATGVLNFAQGGFLMVGAMLGAGLWAEQHWSLAVAIIVAVAAGAVIGALEERAAVNPAISRGGAVGWVVATLGFAIILQAAFAIVMGTTERAFPTFVPVTPLHIGGAVLDYETIMLVGLSIGIGLLLSVFYERTRVGWALMAIAHDREAAAIRGIPVARLATASFALGAALAALTGFVAGPVIGASPTIGFTMSLNGFVAAAAGGIPNIRGAVIGGFAVGLIEAIGVRLFGAGYRDIIVFGLLVLTLTVRPHGLFGRAAARAV